MFFFFFALVSDLKGRTFFSLLLDAMFLADTGLYNRYFSTAPGSASSSLDPYMFPVSVLNVDVEPELQSSLLSSSVPFP